MLLRNVICNLSAQEARNRIPVIQDTTETFFREIYNCITIEALDERDREEEREKKMSISFRLQYVASSDTFRIDDSCQIVPGEDVRRYVDANCTLPHNHKREKLFFISVSVFQMSDIGTNFRELCVAAMRDEIIVQKFPSS